MTPIGLEESEKMKNTPQLLGLHFIEARVQYQLVSLDDKSFSRYGIFWDFTICVFSEIGLTCFEILFFS